MSFPHAMETLARLTASAEALAALGAGLRADVEQIELDPAISDALDGIQRELGIAGLSPQEKSTVALFARAFLRQAVDLADHPERPPGWGYEDPVVLLSLGRGSASIAGAVAAIPELDAALSADGAALLDVGAGVAALSVACAARWPGLKVVGLEPWPAAHALAEQTIAGTTVELRDTRVEDLAEYEAFDVAWLPVPFVSPAVMPVALERLRAALKPNGLLIFGQYFAPPDPLAQRIVALRTTRSGGHAWSGDEAIAALLAAGFDDAYEVQRTWPSPVTIVLGRRE